MKTITVAGRNVVPNTNNAVYRVSLTGMPNLLKKKIAVGKLSMYYSWFNITSSTTGGKYNNNTYTYTWPVGPTTVTVTMPDGFYTVSSLNSYLQSVMIANGHYLIDSSGNYVYYLQWLENSTYYSVQLSSSVLPTSLPSGYTAPGSWPGYPGSNVNPQVTISSSNSFKDVVGFSAGTYPSSSAYGAAYDHLSRDDSLVPQVTPVSSVIVTCNVVDNPYSNPSNIIYTFSPDATFGSQINEKPVQYAPVTVKDGQVSDIQLTFYGVTTGSVYSYLPIRDTNLLVELVLMDDDQD